MRLAEQADEVGLPYTCITRQENISHVLYTRKRTCQEKKIKIENV